MPADHATDDAIAPPPDPHIGCLNCGFVSRPAQLSDCPSCGQETKSSRRPSVNLASSQVAAKSPAMARCGAR